MIQRHLRTLALAAGVALATLPGAVTTAAAQGQFSVVARVNDDIVTSYEVQQRQRFLSLLNAPGDVVASARDTLINERLQNQAARRLGLSATPEDIEAGVAEFAGRANMAPEQFINALGASGVAPETLRDFVRSGVNWRNVVRARFTASAQVSDAEVDRALAGGGGTGAAAIDYATIPIVGGRGQDALTRAQRLRDSVDTCNDLYGVRPEGLERHVRQQAEIPADIAAALSRLDPGEMSFDITRGEGTLLLVTMLCGRTTDVPDEARAQLREQLFQQRMGAFAAGFLEELRDEAVIVLGDG